MTQDQDPFTVFENEIEKKIEDVENQNEKLERESIILDEEPEEPKKPERKFDVEKEDLRVKFERVQKERYRIAEENHQLRQYLDEAIKHTSQSSDAALLHMEQNQQLILNSALEVKRKALEEGDTDLALQADVEIGRSMAKLENLENYQKQKIFEQQRQQALQEQLVQQQLLAQQQAAAQQFQAQALPEPVHAWLNENPWFLPNSPYYDPEKSQELQAFTKVLDKKMAREGRQNEYFSKEYFDKINNYIDENFGSRNRVPYRDTNRSAVSGVSRSSGSSQSKEKVTLSEDEKEMARAMGVREELWAQHKKNDLKRQKERSMAYGTY